jgi:hypothetical protein
MSIDKFLKSILSYLKKGVLIKLNISARLDGGVKVGYLYFDYYC